MLITKQSYFEMPALKERWLTLELANTNANNITNANHIIENNDTKNAKKKTKKTKK